MALIRSGSLALAVGIAALVTTSVSAQHGRYDYSDWKGKGKHTQKGSQGNTKPSGESETVNKTVAFPSGGTLKVDTFSGTVHINATNGHDVVVKAVRTADRDVLDRVHFSVDTAGSTVTINANKVEDKDRHHDNNVVYTELDVDVPAAAKLDVTSFSSPIDVKGVTGDQKLDTFSGTITVTGAKAAMNAHTFSGNVDIDLAGAGASPSARAETFSGSIKLKLAESAKADVDFNSFSGEFNSELPVTMHSVKRRNVSGRINGDASGSSSSTGLRLQTFSGDVKIVK